MGQLQRQAEEEAEKIAQNLRELRATILAEAHQKPDQLEFWTTTEQEQLDRNRAALLTRAEEIPAEIERETKRLLTRYEKPVPRLFPVAVTYVVPRRLA